MKISARNPLRGTVETVSLGVVTAQIGIRVGENLIESVITRQSAEEMNIKVGQQITAVIKSTEVVLMVASTIVAVGGALTAYLFYYAKPELPEKLATQAHAMYSILLNKYHVDEIYDAIIVLPIVQTSREFLWKFVDVTIIDGSVNGVGNLVRGSAGGLRHMQSGYVRTYAGWILLGGVLVVVWFLR